MTSDDMAVHLGFRLRFYEDPNSSQRGWVVDPDPVSRLPVPVAKTGLRWAGPTEIMLWCILCQVCGIPMFAQKGPTP